MIFYGQETEKEEKKQDVSNIAMEKLLKSRTIVISGEITQALAEKVTTQLLVLEQMGDEPIKIFINSQGGHVESGDTIHDMIKFVKPKVIIIGTGWVASAGITIYLAADKENRYSLPNTRYMIHQPIGGFQGQATDIDIHAKRILKIKETLTRTMAESTNGKVDYETMVQMCERDNFMSADEALNIGLIDEVIVKNKK